MTYFINTYEKAGIGYRFESESDAFNTYQQARDNVMIVGCNAGFEETGTSYVITIMYDDDGNELERFDLTYVFEKAEDVGRYDAYISQIARDDVKFDYITSRGV